MVTCDRLRKLKAFPCVEKGASHVLQYVARSIDEYVKNFEKPRRYA